ncbi:unnamed protein product [Paramecium pentaurelia]|uniref:Transmembrane protein n=1 Tax=Paramecium pentaurelia TaxID=43138 RepID=A0A8S1VSP0_9CILI|nr:unnamed protein product [Paramecium pentaurelia]
MYYLLIILGFHIFRLNSKAINCEVLQVQPKITCHQYIKDCFVLEGNEEDYYKLKSVDKEIVQKSFTIPYKDIPIQIKVLKLLNYGLIYEKLICSLYMNQKYYITCINFDTLDYDKNNGNAQEQIMIETSISSQETCDEIYNLNENLIIFCLSQFSLKQYSVNLLGETNLILEYGVSIQIQDQCKKKQQQILGKNQFLIVFYQCSQWTILEINQQQILLILQSKIDEHYSFFQDLYKVDDVQFCEIGVQIIYLIEGNNYIQVRWNSNQIVIPQLYKIKKQILKILPLKKCLNIMLITYLKENDSQSIQQFDNEIELNYPYKSDQIYILSNLLVLQNQTELIIRIDKHLIQTYQILNSSLTFLKEDNLFYQLDKTKNILQFYRYFPISSFIEPKLKFVYFILKTDGQERQSLMSCFKMQYEKNLDIKINQKEQVLIKKDCQNRQQIIIKIHDFEQFLFQKVTFYHNKTKVFNLSIWNHQKNQNLCYQQLQRYKFKRKIILISMQILNYIVFQVQNLLYFHNCEQNKIQMSIDTNQYEVFRINQDYYIIDKINKQVKVILFGSGSINQIQLHSNIEILKVQQMNQELIIYLKNEKNPILISKTYNLQNSKKYLSQRLNYPNEILFYQEFGNYKFIQYLNIFAQELNGIVKCFHLEDVLILSMKSTLKDIFSILSVQNQTNSIILYQFDQFELQQLYNYTLQEYSFSNPFKYNVIYSNFAILVKQNQSMFIAFMSFSDQKISLIDVKSTDDMYFEFVNDSLLYLNNSQMQQHYLKEMTVIIETNIQFQKTLISQYQLSLIPTFNQQDKIHFEFFIQNQCYNLFSLKNSISYSLTKNQNLQIKISEIFQGPIHNLTIQGNSKFQLRTPFQFQQEIKQCQNETFLCIKQINLKHLIQTYTAFAIILEDKTVFQIQQPNFEDINQVFWIEVHLFLWFSKLEDELLIKLLECIIENDKTCTEIQTKIIKFKTQKPLNQHIFKSKNIFKLQNEQNQIHLFIKNQNFQIIDLLDFNFDIKYIEKSQDQYLALQRLNQEYQFQLKLLIYQIHSNGSFEILSQLITNKIQNLLPTFEIVKEIKLVQSNQNENFIFANLLISNQQSYFIMRLQIDVQNNSIISFLLTKQIRQPVSDLSFQLDYVDENYLLFTSLYRNVTFFYDIQEDRLFYDFIYRLNYYIQIIKLNITHFIFFNQSTIHLGIIKQYEIELQNIEDINQEFILFAQNDVSDAQILIQIINEKSFNDFNKNIILIQLINQVVIILYLNQQYIQNTRKKIRQTHE